MGEYLLRARWEKPGAKVESAGIAALVNYPAEEDAMTVMEDQGIDMSGHRARQLTPRMASGFDLILGMEPMHIEWINRRMPTARGRVHLMGKWLNEEAVPDPYRQGLPAFAACYELLNEAVDSWLQKI